MSSGRSAHDWGTDSATGATVHGAHTGSTTGTIVATARCGQLQATTKKGATAAGDQPEQGADRLQVVNKE